ERTQEAIASRREQGLPVGRPIATDTTKAVQDCKENGLTQAQTAEKLNVSIRTVKYHWKR
ncbi:MalT transcriptional regulator family protein, partial [Herbiconiux daphne]